MNATGGVQAQVLEISQRSYHVQFIGRVYVTKLACQNDMQCRRQRRTVLVVSNGIIIVPVHALGLKIKMFIHQSQQHQDIGLLDDLVALYWFHAQDALVGGGTALILILIEWLQLEKTVKLLDQPCLLVLRNTYTRNYITPVIQASTDQIKLSRQFLRFVGSSSIEPVQNI